MLPGGALILFITPYIKNKIQKIRRNPRAPVVPNWFPTFFCVFCLLYMGLTPYEKNVAWRGTYSFHRGLTPYEKVRFALFWNNLGRLGALGFLRFFLYFVFYIGG